MAQMDPPASTTPRQPARFKPPVPARPKNLVVLNSRNLPKPPENVLTGNVANLIRGLNVGGGEEKKTSHNLPGKNISIDKTAVTPNSDEEDIDGYLEPVSLSISNILMSNRKTSPRPQVAQNTKNEESAKVSNLQQQSNNITVNNEDKHRGDGDRLHISHSHRPLPLPPVKKETEVTLMPWYKNVDRKRGEELLKDGMDGYFLVRPSSKEDTFLTLTLWFHNRLYNIPIRKRRDGKYALGTPKTNEQCFESVEEMVVNYQSEKLLLYSNGAKAGRTLLTTYPP